MFTVHNDDFNENVLSLVVDTNFPTEEFTLLSHVFYLLDRPSKFQTPWSAGPLPPFTSGNDYQVCFDGSGTTPNGGVAPSSDFAIGSGGDDTYHTTIGPTTGRWYRQAYRRRKIGVNNYEQFYYIDLAAGTDKVSRPHLAPLTFAAGHVLYLASTPWTSQPGSEGIDGNMRAVKLWSSALSEADIQSESPYSSIVVPANNGSLWGRWPCVSNGNDFSGNARHFSTIGTVVFDGLDILPSLGGQMLMGVG